MTLTRDGQPSTDHAPSRFYLEATRPQYVREHGHTELAAKVRVILDFNALVWISRMWPCSPTAFARPSTSPWLVSSNDPLKCTRASSVGGVGVASTRKGAWSARVPELDGLRGLAILGVLGYHGGWIPAGTRGVTTFFVLSGFLITTVLMREFADRGRVSLRAFYLRRAARLAPALALAMTVLAGLLLIKLPLRQVSWRWASAMTYTSNLVEALAGERTLGAFSYTWSLATEEHYYLLWPPILIGLLGRGKHRAALVGCMIAAILATLVRILTISAGQLDIAYYAPWSRVDALATGCAIAVAMHLRPVRPRRLVAWPALGLLIWTYVTVDVGGSAHLILGQPLTVITTGVLIVHGGAAGPILANRALVRIGLISYGLYLWHGVALELDHAGVLRLPGETWLLMAYVLSELSWRFLEDPIIRWAHVRTQRAQDKSGPPLPLPASP